MGMRKTSGNVSRGAAIAAIIAGMLSVATVSAEPAPGESTALSTSGARNGRLIAGLELRPSHTGHIGEFHTENYVQLGYRFSGGEQLYYRQEFNTNVYDPRLAEAAGGLNAYAYDGSFRTKLGDLWKDDGGRSLSYEGRVYLPTFGLRRDAGMLSQVRSYFRLRQSLGRDVAVGLEEVPIVHLYDRAGVVRPNGRAEANPVFENRVYLTVEVRPMRKVKLFFPVIFQSTRYRAFGKTARLDDRWGHKLWIYPEITYELSPQVTVGLAYYSENLMTADFSRGDFATGLSKGVTQLIVGASL